MPLLPGRTIRAVSTTNYLLDLPDNRTIVFNRQVGKAALYRGPEKRLLDLLSSESAEADPLEGVLRTEGFLNEPDYERQFGRPNSALAAQVNFTLYLLVSQGCNLDCVYCFGRPYRSTRLMSADLAEKSIEHFAKSLSPGSRFRVVFFGGEPLLNSDVIIRAISAFHRAGQSGQVPTPRFHITTNLTTLPPGIIDIIRRYRVGILCDFDPDQSSHDAHRPHAATGTGSWEKVRDNLARLGQEGIPFHIRTTITRQNQHRLPDIVKEVFNSGAKSCGVCPLIPLDSEGDSAAADISPDISRFAHDLLAVAAQFPTQLDRIWPFSECLEHLTKGGGRFACPAPIGGMRAVDAAGDIYTCHYCVGDQSLKLGNIWDSPPEPGGIPDSFVDSADALSLRACRDCPWLFLCAGGCPVHRHHLPDGDRSGYIRAMTCEISKTVYPLLLEHLSNEEGKRGESGGPGPAAQ